MKRPSPDVVPVLRAIEAACVRMQAMPADQPMVYAKAALEELGKIARAKNAYDAEVGLLATADLTDRILDEVFPSGVIMK